MTIKNEKKEIITIQISTYLTNVLAEQIAAAQWNTTESSFVRQVAYMIFDEIQYGGASFEVIAENGSGDLVGRIHCIRSKTDLNLWYYGDLFVLPAYRRMGVATSMIRAAIRYLSEIGAKTLRCYVDADNNASLALQKSLGIEEKPYETFVCGNGCSLVHSEDCRMFERRLASDLTALPATVDDFSFYAALLDQSKEALHVEANYPDDWKKLGAIWKARLSANNPDEESFFICKGAMPVAYLELSGLTGKESARIDMLIVSSPHKRQGIGAFAVEFAEERFSQRGFSSVIIQATPDNTPAKCLFQKLRYSAGSDSASDRTVFKKVLAE